MGIKQIGGAEDFTNKFVKARGGDSTGFGAKGLVDAQGISATGGTTIEYETSPGDIYKSHTFTSPGAFTVSSLSTGPTFPDEVDLLVVGGGGGGGTNIAAGGGGGGMRVFSNVPVSIATYPVTIGDGGTNAGEPTTGGNGGDTTFALTPYGPIVGSGGGGGGSYAGQAGATGGSGGAGCGHGGGGAGASAIVSPDGISPTTQGNAGGSGSPGGGPDAFSGGGGGAGASGGNGVGPAGTGTGGNGGDGLVNSFRNNAAVYYAGGGGGSGHPGNTGGVFGNGQGKGGQGGAGDGAFTGNPTPMGAGDANTGGGAGGDSGSGGSGIVVVRYKINALDSTAKATGGNISFTSSKTIHTFLSPGAFTVTNGPISCDYLVDVSYTLLTMQTKA